MSDSLLKPVCRVCGADAVWVAEEAVHRHAKQPFEDQSTFCDRYGYPIEVTYEMHCTNVTETVDILAGDAALKNMRQAITDIGVGLEFARGFRVGRDAAAQVCRDRSNNWLLCRGLDGVACADAIEKLEPKGRQ